MLGKVRSILSSNKVRRMFAGIITIIAISALVWYFSTHTDEFNRLRSLSIRDLLIMSALVLLGHMLVAYKLQVTTTVFGVKHPLWESFFLVESGSLVNLIPINAGSGLRAMYLKNVRGLMFVQFGLGFLSVFLTSLTAAGLLGLISLVFADVDSPLLYMIFGAYLLCPLVIIILALTIGRRTSPTQNSKSSAGLIRNLSYSAMQGLSILSKRPAVFIFWLTLDLLANLILGGRFWIAATGLGYDFSFAEALAMQSVGRASTFATIVPSGTLGIREALVGLGAVGLGQPAIDGVLIATVDRMVAVIWIALFGVVGLFILRKQLEKKYRTRENNDKEIENSSKKSLA